MEKLIAEMKSIADFSSTDIELFINSFEASFIPKGEYFLKEGQISRHLGYITSGLTMHYKLNDGIEIPFKKQNSILKGIMIAPSIRFWPTVSSRLKDDKYTYDNKITKNTAEIETLNPGIGFTPVVFNVSIGYSF